jgi:hypothetical protein
LGDEEKAQQFFMEACKRVLLYQCIIPEFEDSIPKSLRSGLKEVWGMYTKLIGQVVVFSPEMLQGLLEPIKALPNSDNLLASSPLLKLLYTQLRTVMKNPELLNLLLQIVQGILGKNSNTESDAFKYLVRIVQVSGRELLDKRTVKKSAED